MRAGRGTSVSSIKIGNDQQPLDDVSPGWITQQIERRRRDGIAVCVEVRIKTTGLDMRLATPGCSHNGGGGGRRPNVHEKAILDLWGECGLNEAGFSPGRVIEFLARLKRLL